MGQYVDIKDLPTAVQTALTSVGYGRKNIEVIVSTAISLDNGGSDGARAFVTLVNLTSGAHTTHYGSWGGQNMFDRSNVVDNDRNSYPLPADGVAITGSTGGGRPVWAQLHIPASMVARMLPAAVEPLSTVELDALYCHGSIKGGAYRRDELARRHVPAAVVDDLVTRGLLSRNRAGATAITTAGRNAVGSYRGH